MTHRLRYERSAERAHLSAITVLIMQSAGGRLDITHSSRPLHVIVSHDNKRATDFSHIDQITQFNAVRPPARTFTGRQAPCQTDRPRMGTRATGGGGHSLPRSNDSYNNRRSKHRTPRSGASTDASLAGAHPLSGGSKKSH